ncbi:MAG: leucyl/phenylalanyl-tRNA--protein transferase [Phycisphaerales bacterium]|nr:leucyl/phenylalanyl-tRNA--protein transferase [Phycisphaerales bacterium]
MADPREHTDVIEWVQPRHRALIPLDDRFRVARSLAQRVRSRRFLVTTDHAFANVISACASVPRPRDAGDDGTSSTWLCPGIIRAFLALHNKGHAHSIEAWLPVSQTPRPAAELLLVRNLGPQSTPHVLVGGLYGVALGRVFCGESMFHRPDLGGTDASKVCLVHLVHHLRRRGFAILDSQIANDHVAQFGMEEVPAEEYLAQLAQVRDQSTQWQPFTPCAL